MFEQVKKSVICEIGSAMKGLNQIFISVRILSFNAIHSVIKKMFHKCQVAANGACQKWHILHYKTFYFGKNCAET
jgi:hypothetical protein